MNSNTITPAADAANCRIALDAARKHFAGRKPTYAEAYEYAGEIGFRARREVALHGDWSKKDDVAANARHYALVAALELHRAD